MNRPAADVMPHNLSEREQAVRRINRAGFCYAGALALIGLMWLIAVTKPAHVAANWPTLLLLFILGLLFKRFRFFLVFEMKPGIYSDISGSLESVVGWSAALLFGPSGLWLGVFWQIIDLVGDLPRANGSITMRWVLWRNFAFGLLNETFIALIAVLLYERWGGLFPLPGLAPPDMALAVLTTFVRIALSNLIFLPYLVATSSLWRVPKGVLPIRRILEFNAVILLIPYLTDPFAIVGAGLFTQNGLPAFLFFAAGLLLTSILAHQLSRAVERSGQRTRELEKAEQLGHAIIAAPPDGSRLPALLREHVPGMFPRMQIDIRVFPHTTLLHYPDDGLLTTESMWGWLQEATAPRVLLPGVALPWNQEVNTNGLIVAPIIGMESGKPVGGIYLWQQRDLITLVQRRGVDEMTNLLPAVQSLAAQIASALHSADTYTQTLINQRIAQELSLAGKIQASFLPREVPQIDGWQLAAALEPARQTSGDFYDFVPLPDNRMGFVIADVADKGMGAALYMALSRTLIRIYAHECCDEPAQALEAANRRILRDTHNDLFVTVFYVVLDPQTGILTYCNAGHNPPYWLRGQNGAPPQPLGRTGMPLGLFDDQVWEQRTVHLAPGDALVMYTDGLTDALNNREEMFGDARLLDLLRSCRGRSAQAIQSALLASVHRFAGGTPPFDDITLLVIYRDQLQSTT
ncbi:MAG: PP2C family protein-serine/threonine phosphatase [Anaerolineae bacterium]|nr:PP2C family protein-serine/threonine phosphatase [Anaerolineae bacterium]